MKAKKYKIKVYDSELNISHNYGEVINEVFIPELEICFNEKYNVFRWYNDSRWKIHSNEVEDIEIDDSVAQKLNTFVKRKESMTKWIDGFFNEEKTEDYESIDMDLPNDVILDLSIKAHEADLTLNEFISYTFEEYIKYEDSKKSGEVRSFNTTTECSSDHSDCS